MVPVKKIVSTRAFFVLLLLFLGAWHPKSPSVHSKSSRFGFAPTPLTFLADSLAAFTEAAMLGKPLPKLPFPVAKRPKHRAGWVSSKNKRGQPKLPLRWVAFAMEVEFVLSPNGTRRFTVTVVVTRHGIRMLKYSSHQEPNIAGLNKRVVRALTEVVAQVRAHAAAGQMNTYRLKAEDLKGMSPSFAAEMLQVSGELDRVGRNLTEMSNLQFHLDKLGLVAVDALGRTVLVTLNLDENPGGGYFLSADPWIETKMIR